MILNECSFRQGVGNNRKELGVGAMKGFIAPTKVPSGLFGTFKTDRSEMLACQIRTCRTEGRK
jgi:hypothetical protein